jgi:hypothetical protein
VKEKGRKSTRRRRRRNHQRSEQGAWLASPQSTFSSGGSSTRSHSRRRHRRRRRRQVRWQPDVARASCACPWIVWLARTVNCLLFCRADLLFMPCSCTLFPFTPIPTHFSLSVFKFMDMYAVTISHLTYVFAIGFGPSSI